MRTLVKHNPWNSLLNDSFFNDPFEGGRSNLPAVNILENDENFVVELAVPGRNKEDFNIKVRENRLVISHKLEAKKDRETKKYSLREFTSNSFERSFTLPKGKVNTDAIKANYENGILSVELPKQEEAKPVEHFIKVA